MSSGYTTFCNSLSRYAGMRNFIVHEYEEIDYDLVWKAVSIDLPAITPRLEEIYKAFDFPDDFIPPPAPTEEH